MSQFTIEELEDFFFDEMKMHLKEPSYWDFFVGRFAVESIPEKLVWKAITKVSKRIEGDENTKIAKENASVYLEARKRHILVFKVREWSAGTSQRDPSIWGFFFAAQAKKLGAEVLIECIEEVANQNPPEEIYKSCPENCKRFLEYYKKEKAEGRW